MTDDAPSSPPAALPPEFDPATFDGVMMTFDRACCAVHGSTFREYWPKGYAIFMVRIFQELTAVDGIWDQAKQLAGKDEVTPKDLERVMDLKPACCRVSKTTLIKVLGECGVGDLRRCATCRKRSLGVPITAANASWPHVCFTCIAHATPHPPGAS